jgi:hypothetical protein
MVNGQSGYRCMISAGGGNPDTFRIQIWGGDGGSTKVHKVRTHDTS